MSFQMITSEELDAKLAAIDVAKVRSFLGPEIEELHAFIKQAVFRRLTQFNKPNVDKALDTVLNNMELKVDDLTAAQKMFAKKQGNYEKFEQFLKTTQIEDIANSLKKQLAAKLLFQLIDPVQDIQNGEGDSQLLKQVKMLTILLNHYAKASAQLQKNFSVDCIWDCRFKPHIAKQLALRRLQDEGEDGASVELYEGQEQNIHQVLACVCFPTADELSQRLLDILKQCQQTTTGSELVRRLIQNQMIDKFIVRCIQDTHYAKAKQICFDALRPAKFAENISIKQSEEELAEIQDEFTGTWFLMDDKQTQIKTFRVNRDSTMESFEQGASTKGKWQLLSKKQAEIVIKDDRFVFELSQELKLCQCTNKQGLFIKRVMDPSQFYGEWSWCHNGVARECELILNDKRGGQSGGSPETYWYINPDYTVYIGRLNKNDEHIFKVIDDNTLEIIKPQRNPPTRCLRVTPVPPRKTPILYPQQLVGEWNWCHDPTNPAQKTPHTLFADGSIKNDGREKGLWKIEPDGHIFVGRLNPGDRHIFRVVDENTLELIEPKRNPPTQMQRIGSAPSNPYKRNQLKLTSKELMMNSLVINLLLTQKPEQFNFWADILPQLFEMLLFSLSWQCSKRKVRTILEQCQLILNFAYQHAQAFAESGLIDSLLRSPILEQYLTIAGKGNKNDENLSLLLVSDLKVQQIQCQNLVETKKKTLMPNPGSVRQIVEQLLSLQEQFGSSKLDIDDKKNFLIEFASTLPKLTCWETKITLSSKEESKDGKHTIDLNEHGPFTSFVVKSVPESAQGNADRVIAIQQANNTVNFHNLKNPIELVCNNKPITFDFNVLPQRYLRGTSSRAGFILMTSLGQLTTSFKVQLDDIISGCDDGVYFWCKNRKEIWQLNLNGEFSKPVLPEPMGIDWGSSRPQVKVQEYFGRRLYLDGGAVILGDGENKQKDLFDFGDDNHIKEMSACKNTALFITTQGTLFTSGLTNLADGKSEGKLEVKKIDSTLFPDLSDNVKFTRCWIQSNDPKQPSSNTGYAIVEAVIDDKKAQFYSFGINLFGCLGNGLDVSKPTTTFTPLVGDFSETHFEYVFLSPQLAIGLDAFTGEMWVLGGKAPFKDNIYFPDSFNEINNFPLRTTLIAQLKQQFGDESFIKCENVVMAEESMLLYLNLFKDGRMDGLCYRIKKATSNANACELELLSFVDQTVKDVAQIQGRVVLVLEKAQSFNEAYSVEIQIKPDFEKSITSQNCEQILASVQTEWDQFADKMQAAMDTQFAFDVLDCINKYVSIQQTDCSASFFENLKPSQIELKGHSFETEDDRRLARVIVGKLLKINKHHAALYNTKIHTTFESDPFSYISPGQGLPSACRNWSNVLKSKKRFLCDKLLEQQFLKLIKNLPYDDRSRIEISINRYAARRFCDSGKVDTGDGDTVFTQIMRGIKAADPQFTSWRKRDLNSAVFRANFQHEGSIDAGGPYREAHEQMCREVMTGALPLLIPTENQRTNDGEMREAFVLNHNSITPKELELFFKMGCWIGNAIRTGQPLSLTLHPVVWKRIVGADNFTLRDLKLSSIHEFNQIDFVREAASHSGSNEDFQNVVDQNFTVSYGGNTIELCANGYAKKVTLENHAEYIRLAVHALLTKDELQMAEFKRGIYHILSKQAMQACSWKYAEERACGKQTIDIDILRKHSTFSSSLKNKKIDGQSFEDVFWKVLGGFDEENKRLYMKFVTGRSKLPLDIKSQSYPHTVTSMGGNNATLPQAHICYNQIDMPPYTTEQAMRQRILTAIQFCGEVDTDGVRHSDY